MTSCHEASTYGGAARIWWPGVTPLSRRWDHNLWSADVPARIIDRVASAMIVDAGIAAANPDPRIAQLARHRVQAEVDRMRSELDRMRENYDLSLMEASETSEATEATIRLAEAQADLLKEITSERDTWFGLASSYQQDSEAQKQRAGAAERERDYLRTELARLRESSASAGSGEQDPLETALHDRIQFEMRSRGDVEGARPRRSTLGPVFAVNVESLGERYCDKVAKACVDVIIGSAGLLARRDDHQLRVDDGPNAKSRVRSRDQAQAHRCYIEHGTPSARRLHYWVLQDNAVEFASVNIHDDMTIPE
jgi:hypothetical protein